MRRAYPEVPLVRSIAGRGVEVVGREDHLGMGTTWAVRADLALDGVRFLPGGAIVVVECHVHLVADVEALARPAAVWLGGAPVVG